MRTKEMTSDPKDNPFPAIPEPGTDIASLLATVQRLRETVQILTGARGPGDNRAVLRKEIP